MGEHGTSGPGERWGGRTVRWAVAGAVVVAAACAGLLVLDRFAPEHESSSSDCGVLCQPGGPSGASSSASPGSPSSSTGPSGPGTPSSPRPSTPAPAGPRRTTGRTPPSQTAPSATPPATSSAPVSASALVQFKVTSHWGDGYRADVTITDTGQAPLAGWRLTFHVTGAHLHQPTDTGEAAMAGDVVSVTPAAWRRPLAGGAQAVFGMGFDGVLTAPGGCVFDGVPCSMQYVDTVPGQ